MSASLFKNQERRLQSLRDQNIVVVGGCLSSGSQSEIVSPSQAVRPEGSGPGPSTASITVLSLSLVSTRPLLVTTETQPRAHHTVPQMRGQGDSETMYSSHWQRQSSQCSAVQCYIFKIYWVMTKPWVWGWDMWVSVWADDCWELFPVSVVVFSVPRH